MKEPQFWELELDEKNENDLQKWIRENNLVGLVDEELGGIIGYTVYAHATYVNGTYEPKPYPACPRLFKPRQDR